MPKTGRRDDWEKTRWIVRSLDLTVALSEMTRAFGCERPFSELKRRREALSLVYVYAAGDGGD